jgi:hypothetical protein
MYYTCINYTLLFFKLWSLNKLLLGVPFYIIEHLILSNILHITYKGGKMLILGIGSGIYYLAFSSPIEVLENDFNTQKTIQNMKGNDDNYIKDYIVVNDDYLDNIDNINSLEINKDNSQIIKNSKINDIDNVVDWKNDIDDIDDIDDVVDWKNDVDNVNDISDYIVLTTNVNNEFEY